MDVLILTGAELSQRPDLERSVFALRHSVFVDKLGWEAIRSPDNLERDAFDTDEAVHFIVLSTDGSIAAYSRLLATTRPHLLSNVYPHLLNDASAPPTGANIWEWTRTTAIPRPTTIKNRDDDVGGLGFSMTAAGRTLIFSIVQWAAQNSVDTLSLQCDPAFAFVIVALGATARLLAEPSLTTEKQVVVPMLLCLNAGTVESTERLFWPKKEEVVLQQDEEKTDQRARL